MYSLVLFAALGVPTPPAQSAEAAPWRDSLQRLDAAYARLQDSLLRGDTAVVEVGRSGDLVMHASPVLRAGARRALDLIATHRRDWFGADPVGFRIAARASAPGTRGPSSRATATVVLVGLPDTGATHRVLLPLGLPLLEDGEQLAGFLLRAIAAHPAVRPGPSLGAWLGSDLPTYQDPGARRREALYALVTGLGPSHQLCVAGDLSACARLLGLEATPVGTRTPRLPISVRGDFVLSILEWSDEGAWRRLTTPGEVPVIERLESAGGAPLDSLISRWRRETLALRPDSGPIKGPTVVAALAWSAVLLTGLLGVSRWL